MRYALINNDVVENIVLWDGEGDIFDDYIKVELSDDVECGIGWAYENGEFIAPTEMEKTKDELITEAESQKQSLIYEANTKISVLQDAVDLEMATEEEVALLKEWKKYRVLLNRVDTSTAPDIEWPEKPSE